MTTSTQANIYAAEWGVSSMPGDPDGGLDHPALSRLKTLDKPTLDTAAKTLIARRPTVSDMLCEPHLIRRVAKDGIGVVLLDVISQTDGIQRDTLVAQFNEMVAATTSRPHAVPA